MTTRPLLQAGRRPQWEGRGIKLAALLMLIAVSAGGCDRRDPPRVTIAGRSWSVELAMTEQQRRDGLSGRARLAEDAGMLFLYPRPQVLNFCMRGCLIPLDIAFIDSELRVVKTYTMAVEPDLEGSTVYSSQVPAQFALEVAAGSLARAGVRIGQQVTFSAGVSNAAKAQDGL